VAVFNTWNRGNDTILKYSLVRNEHRIVIEGRLGYFDSFNAGGPIRPLSYNTPTRCPFHWDFPALDFKILNNNTATLFLTEVVLDIEESRFDNRPFFTIKSDVLQCKAGALLLMNEGWCDLVDLTISFNLCPGQISGNMEFRQPYKHSIELPLLAD